VRADIFPRDSEKLKEIEKLSMDVSTDCNWRMETKNIWFARKDFSECEEEGLKSGFGNSTVGSKLGSERGGIEIEKVS
jgi:hypothetical protein